MAFEVPDSMEELVYWTNRTLGKKGHVKAWVERETCPKCKKGLMGKPVKDSGKVKIRAKKYECPECGYTVPKQEYEDSLTAKIIYTCPHCEHKGETKIPFQRRTYMGEKALVFKCENCKRELPITKKLKDVKLKK